MRNAIATSKVKMSSSAEKKVNMTTSETFFWCAHMNLVVSTYHGWIHLQHTRLAFVFA